MEVAEPGGHGLGQGFDQAVRGWRRRPVAVVAAVVVDQVEAEAAEEALVEVEILPSSQVVDRAEAGHMPVEDAAAAACEYSGAVQSAGSTFSSPGGSSRLAVAFESVAEWRWEGFDRSG